MARLIDADGVIEEINNIISNIAFTSPYQNDIPVMASGMERVLSVVEDAPTIDAKPVVHGEWIIEDDLMEGRYTLTCSVCNRIVFNIIDPMKAIAYRPYCHCGAKMDGERKET